MCDHKVYTYTGCGHQHSDGYELCQAAKNNGDVPCQREGMGSVDKGTRTGRCEACHLATPPDSE